MFLSKLFKRRKNGLGQQCQRSDDSDDYDSYHNLDLSHNDKAEAHNYEHAKIRNRSLDDVYSLLEKHDVDVKVLISSIPSQTVESLKAIQKNYPRVFTSLMQKFEETVKSQVEDLIDRSILAVARSRGKISSLKLLEEITINKNICTQSTLYLHLKKLVKDGILIREREGKMVYYSFPPMKVEELKQEPKIREDYDYDQP